MKKITTILGLNSDDELFNYFISTLKVKGITQWNYFINWDKVYNNINPIEMELNLLNTLVGKDDIESHLTDLIIKYPQVVNVIPVLLAIRFKTRAEQIINIIDDVSKFTYETFDLSKSNPSKEDAMAIAKFFIKTGLGKLLQEKKVKNLVDYALGVEVGLDSNGRKNRGGHQMENAVVTKVKLKVDIGLGKNWLEAH